MSAVPTLRVDVVVVGSGFAGSILARLLALAGRSVLLVERGRHPRFALGESSTPLAAIALERLARRLEALHPGSGRDLAALAAANRWARHLDPPAGAGGDPAGSASPALRRGLKRGFTFYAHEPGRPYRNSPANDARLLVAASPDDALADNHWLRADVDHHLARRAVAAGATLWEGCELDGVEMTERREEEAAGEDGEAEEAGEDRSARQDGSRVDRSGRGAGPAVRLTGVGLPAAERGESGAAGVERLARQDGGRVDRSGPGAGAADQRERGGAGPSGSAAPGPPGPGQRFEVHADFLVDASGPGGFLAHHLPLAPVDPGTPDTALLYGHFAGVGRFCAAAREAGARLDDGPYPDDRAAVHHLLEEGWMYVLRFDPEDREGRALASAGFVLRRDAADALSTLPPEEAFAALLGRYPTLASSFEAARPVHPVARVDRLPHRLDRAVGRHWLLLPHAYAFFDPLFSTGMAWSLVGVERAADLLLGRGSPSGALPPASPRDRRPAAVDLARYAELLAAEADQVADLVAGAWAARGDFRHTTAHAQLYFAAASFQEAKQRLVPATGDGPAWDGFLGAADPVLRTVVAQARRRLEGDPATTAEDFEAWVAGAIAPRNLAGLADPRRRNLYPVDLEALVEAAALLGLTRQQVEAALPRLRGGAWAEGRG